MPTWTAKGPATFREEHPGTQVGQPGQFSQLAGASTALQLTQLVSHGSALILSPRLPVLRLRCVLCLQGLLGSQLDVPPTGP